MAEDKQPTTTNQSLPGITRSGYTALTFDVSLYEKYLEGSGLSEKQKTQFLHALWLVMVGFVDLGFDIHPLQQAAPEGCGQELDLTSFVAPDVISSNKETSQNQFTSAADCSDEQEVKGMES